MGVVGDGDHREHRDKAVVECGEAVVVAHAVVIEEELTDLGTEPLDERLDARQPLGVGGEAVDQRVEVGGVVGPEAEPFKIGPG